MGTFPLVREKQITYYVISEDAEWITITGPASQRKALLARAKEEAEELMADLEEWEYFDPQVFIVRHVKEYK